MDLDESRLQGLSSLCGHNSPHIWTHLFSFNERAKRGLWVGRLRLFERPFGPRRENLLNHTAGTEDAHRTRLWVEPDMDVCRAVSAIEGRGIRLFCRLQHALAINSALSTQLYEGANKLLAHFCLPSRLAAPIKKDAGVTHVSRPAAVIEGIIARLQRGSNRAISHEAGPQRPVRGVSWGA